MTHAMPPVTQTWSSTVSIEARLHPHSPNVARDNGWWAIYHRSTSFFFLFFLFSISQHNYMFVLCFFFFFNFSPCPYVLDGLFLFLALFFFSNSKYKFKPCTLYFYIHLICGMFTDNIQFILFSILPLFFFKSLHSLFLLNNEELTSFNHHYPFNSL
jgi:hypothetical protein